MNKTDVYGIDNEPMFEIDTNTVKYLFDFFNKISNEIIEKLNFIVVSVSTFKIEIRIYSNKDNQWVFSMDENGFFPNEPEYFGGLPKNKNDFYTFAAIDP